MLTTKQRTAFIEIIRDCPSEISDLVDGLSPEQLTTSYISGEWTVAQNIHHLVDAHTNSYLRLKMILTSERPLMQIIDQNEFANLADAQSADVQFSLMMLTGLHHRWVIAWQSMSDADWNRIGLIRGTKEITPDYLLENYANHCRNHIQQITSTLAAGGIR